MEIQCQSVKEENKSRWIEQITTKGKNTKKKKHKNNIAKKSEGNFLNWFHCKKKLENRKEKTKRMSK